MFNDMRVISKKKLKVKDIFDGIENVEKIISSI